jgi:hypothetical protein
LAFSKEIRTFYRHRPPATNRMNPPFGTLTYGNHSFEFEKTNLYGILEPHGHMTWYIELFPPGEDDYLMFNALTFDQAFSPSKLSHIHFSGSNNTADLYEHTVRVEAEDRFLDSVDMSFGAWDPTGQCITLSGKGLIEGEHGLPPIPYSFEARLPFEGLSIFETTREAAQKFLTTHLSDNRGKIALHFEQVPSGLRAVINGQF